MLTKRLTRLAGPISKPQAISRPARPSTFISVRHSTQTAHDNTLHKGTDGGEAHGHESQYDPPGGWLWGIRPGEKKEREGWEIPFYFMCAAWIVAIGAYTMKEDTSIQTWALEEARRRLEKEGILEDTNPEGN